MASGTLALMVCSQSKKAKHIVEINAVNFHNFHFTSTTLDVDLDRYANPDQHKLAMLNECFRNTKTHVQVLSAHGYSSKAGP